MTVLQLGKMLLCDEYGGYLMKRNSIVELWRFIASIIIVLHHSFQIELTGYPFQSGFIWVEFFLMLTGYFTFKHFIGVDGTSLEVISVNSIKYTVKKFSVFIPYTTIALGTVCIRNIFVLKNGIAHNIICLIQECFYLFQEDARLIYELWFFSALLIVFPIFCCLCQIKSKHFLYILSFTYVLLYCNIAKVLNHYTIPYSFFRVINGLLLGVLICYFSSILKQISFSKTRKVCLTLIELATLALAVLATYRNWSYYTFILICLVVGTVLMLSDVSYTKVFSNSYFVWLGKLSLIIYIVHVPVAKIIMSTGIGFKNIQLVYLLGTVVVAIVLNLVVENIRKHVHI